MYVCVCVCVCVIYKPQNEAAWERLGLLRHCKKINLSTSLKFVLTFNLTLYVPCIMFQCVDKLKRCNTSYE